MFPFNYIGNDIDSIDLIQNIWNSGTIFYSHGMYSRLRNQIQIGAIKSLN